MSFVKGESKLPEAAPKWLCRDCGHVMTDDAVLTAPNPFDPTENVNGCPNCKGVDQIEAACQFEGCARPVSGGYPGGYGFRYFSSCWDHRPINPKNTKKEGKADG